MRLCHMVKYNKTGAPLDMSHLYRQPKPKKPQKPPRSAER